MSIQFFRGKTRDLEQAARKSQQAPSCGAHDQRDGEPDGEELPDDVEDEDEEREPIRQATSTTTRRTESS